jgi:predicted kinase
VDNTNPSPEIRAELLAIAKRFHARGIGYYFESKMIDCLGRNSQRTGASRVPDVALFSTIKRLALPGYEEGFDALFYVRLLAEGGFSVVEWDSSLS